MHNHQQKTLNMTIEEEMQSLKYRSIETKSYGQPIEATAALIKLKGKQQQVHYHFTANPETSPAASSSC